MFYNKKFLLFAVFLDKIYIWKKSCSQDIGQILTANQTAGFLNQVFFMKKINEISSFLACWCKFKKIKSWLKIVWLGIIIFDQSCLWTLKLTLKLTVSQEWTNGINWFLHVDTDLQKLKANQKFIVWAWSKIVAASLVMGL